LIGGAAIAGFTVWALGTCTEYAKPVIVAFAIIFGGFPTVREIRDRKKGQPLQKTLADLLFWWCGAVIGAFGWNWIES
jgi:hypothetical protein